VQLHIKARSLHSRPGMTTRKKSELLSVFAKAAADKSLTLAMTRISHTSTFSQRDPPESCTNPSAHRGRGECRMPKRTRSLAWKNKNHTSIVTAGTRRFHPAFPHADGFNGFLRALPGDRAVLPPSPADHPANLTPASGRQDHTTSPSAYAPLVFGRNRVHRIPRPTSVTIAKRPSVQGHGMRESWI
jgi:hypothetical protein